MKGTIDKKLIGGRTCHVFLPADYEKTQLRFPVVYVQDGDKFFELFDSIFQEKEPDSIIIGIAPENRLDEYTPWGANQLHPKFKPFGGKADDYLDLLKSIIKPYMDSNYRTNPDPNHTIILGNSLGGLLSIYAAYTTNTFGIFLSISGSFWYENWIDFMETHFIENKNIYVYMSSGEEEGRDAKDLRKYATKNTKTTYLTLRDKIDRDRVTLYWDGGGHHDNTVTRYQRAFEWLQTLL